MIITAEVVDNNQILGDQITAGNLENITGLAMGRNSSSVVNNNTNHYYPISETEPPRFKEAPWSERDKMILHSDTIASAANTLHRQRLLIIYVPSSVHPETVVRHILYQSQHYFIDLPLWRWPDNNDSPSLDSLLGHENAQESQKGVYICVDVFPSVVVGVDLSNLRRMLELRQQFLILTTSSLREKWHLNDAHSVHWQKLPEDCYQLSYLVDELNRLLNQVSRLLPDVSIEEAAKKLGSPTNIDVFVAKLSKQPNDLDKASIGTLIEDAHQGDLESKIRYLYDQLPEGQSQLLAAGLCLFGGLLEEQFFTALGQLIRGPWRHMFESVTIFDYFHLKPLHSLLVYREQRVEHRHPQQRRILIELAWQSCQYHIRAALPLLADIVIESVNGNKKTEDEKLNDRHLRSVINNVLGEIGRLSVPAVEDTLLRLASHPANWGAQSTAGRAIAQWHTLDNKSSPEFIALLERWQKGQYQSPANYSVNSKHYVQLTIVWTLYYSLLNHNDKSLPTAILNLVYHSLFNEHENVCNEVHRKLFPRLFPQYLDQIIQDWRSRPLPLSEKSPLSPWLVGLVKFAYRCKDLGQLDDVVAWFIDCINQISLQGGLHVFAQLDTIQKRWLIDEIFPRHFGQLSNLLLRFIQDREEGAELIHVFVVAHEKHPKVVDVTVAGWFKQWQKALGASAELQIESWLVALHHIGLVYQEIEKFDQFLPWLDTYLERDDQTQLYRIAEVLRDLHQIQAQLRTKIEQGEVGRAESIYVSTLVEGVVDGWLTDENANKTKHQTALLFWAEREQPNLARQCNQTLLGHISWLTPYIVEPWSRKRRKIVRHLLPVILIIYETDAKIADKILQEWMVRPQPAIQQLAYALQHALRKPILTWFLNLCRLLWILLRYSVQGLLWLCRILHKFIMGT